MKKHLHAGMRLLLWEVTSKSKIWYSNVTMFIKQDIGGLWKKMRKSCIFLSYLFQNVETGGREITFSRQFWTNNTK